MAELVEPNEAPFIAIVDDDASIRKAINGLLRVIGFRSETFASAQELLRSMSLSRADCVISDVNMPGMSGLELHLELLAQGHRIPTILITAYPNEDIRARALDAGVICYLTKPFSDDNFISCVRSALDRDQTENDQ
jgi:FixJ family two-component response regulator